MTDRIKRYLRHERDSIARRLRRKALKVVAVPVAITQSCVNSAARQDRVRVPHAPLRRRFDAQQKNARGAAAPIAAPGRPRLVSPPREALSKYRGTTWTRLTISGPYDARLGEKWQYDVERPNELIVTACYVPAMAEMVVVPPAEAAYWLFPEDRILCIGGPVAGWVIPFRLIKYNDQDVKIAGARYCFVRALGTRPDALDAMFLQWIARA